MTKFDTRFFRPIELTERQLLRYADAARRDLVIAEQSIFPEVIFRFSYDALLKLGIYLIARRGYRVRSIAGHHIRILEATAVIIGDDELEAVANEMRHKRNRDLYDGGVLITQKDSASYLHYVQAVFEKAM